MDHPDPQAPLCFEGKHRGRGNGAPEAQIFGQITSKQAGFHAFWPPKQRHNHPHTPPGLTRPTRPVDHPTGPSTLRAPTLGPPGTRSDCTQQGPGPPGPLCFLVFVFSRPPAASDPPGRALTGESKTHRPAFSCTGGASLPLVGLSKKGMHCSTQDTALLPSDSRIRYQADTR